MDLLTDLRQDEDISFGLYSITFAIAVLSWKTRNRNSEFKIENKKFY